MADQKTIKPEVQDAIDAFAAEIEAEAALEKARRSSHDARVKMADVADRQDFTIYLEKTNGMIAEQREGNGGPAVLEEPEEEPEEPEDEEEPEDQEPEPQGKARAQKRSTAPRKQASSRTSPSRGRRR